jgi:hypothetical protein
MSTQNKLIDLNNALFAQLEKVSDEDLKGENLELEIKRTKAVVSISSQIINNAKTCLDAKKLYNDGGELTNHFLLK